MCPPRCSSPSPTPTAPVRPRPSPLGRLGFGIRDFFQPELTRSQDLASSPTQPSFRPHQKHIWGLTFRLVVARKTPEVLG